MKRIIITCGNIVFKADLDDTPTAEAIFGILPVEGRVNRWGDEIYFDIPCSMELEPDARDTLDPGELGYWPTGNAFCIFFGRTPANRPGDDGRPRAASAVNVVGRITAGLDALQGVKQGSAVKIGKNETAAGA